MPANARAATYLPYDALVRKTDVYVTNGGYGGVQYALRYGVPVVTSSGQEDKPEAAGRMADASIPTPPRLTRSALRCAPCSATPATGRAPNASPPAWPVPGECPSSRRSSTKSARLPRPPRRTGGRWAFAGRSVRTQGSSRGTLRVSWSSRPRLQGPRRRPASGLRPTGQCGQRELRPRRSRSSPG